MRQMTKDLEEKPIEKEEDDRLDLRSISRKDRRKRKKEKLEETIKDMTPKEKRSYLLYYYKEAIIITIIAIIAVSYIGYNVYRGTRPITISYVVLNCKDALNFNSKAIDDYAKAIDKYNGYQIKADTSIEIKKDEYTKDYEHNANSQKYINFTTMATAHYYDVVFTDMEGGIYCSSTDVFYPLDKYLDQDRYNRVKDRIVTAEGMDGKMGEYMLDISDTELAKSLNVGYDKVYVGFAGDQQDNHDRVNDFIDYLFPAK